MKCILPLITGLLCVSLSFAQQPHYTKDTIWDGASSLYLEDSGFIGGHTFVDAALFRFNGIHYNHTNQNFQVQTGFTKGWLTQFNYFTSYDDVGINVDSFTYNGNNTIAGPNFSSAPGSVIMFDEAYFNNGPANSMNITNRNGVYTADREYYAVPPGGIVVAKTLHFNNGITTTRRDNPVDGAIAFVNSANYTNSIAGLSDAQHVDGFVSEYNNDNTSTGFPGHNGSFIFPVGNSSGVYQLSRSGTFNESEDILTVGWVDGDPDVTPDFTGVTGYLGENYNNTDALHRGADIIAIATVGFWDWHHQNGGDENYMALPMSADQMIIVSIPDLTGYTGSTASDLRLVGWNADISKWVNLSAAFPGATGLTKGSTLVGLIPAGTTITALAIGSTSIILPVIFSDFTVKAKDCKAALQWKTSIEQNNSYFKVERSSDGIKFTTIGQVSAVGNSTTTQTYDYTDESPLSGVNYYRITQVDLDGKYTSTTIKSVQIKCEEAENILKAYPNPAGNQLFIKSGRAIAQINILSSNGQTVLKYVPSANQGGTFQMNVQPLQAGIYLAQVVNKDGTIRIIKLVKK
ncbi:MAG: T9SS type A sorting domain-containing protein [Agriterribacter sp.]